MKNLSNIRPHGSLCRRGPGICKIAIAESDSVYQHIKQFSRGSYRHTLFNILRETRIMANKVSFAPNVYVLSQRIFAVCSLP